MNNLDHITNLKQLLRVTIDDVKLVEGDERYKFNVTCWHEPTNIPNKCSVCLAGSIMAKTLGVDIGIGVLPINFDNRTEVLLILINQIRLGEDAIYLQNSLETNGIEFDLNNLDSLNLLNYDLEDGNIDEWEKLYNDLGWNTGTKLKYTIDKIISKGIRTLTRIVT